MEQSNFDQEVLKEAIRNRKVFLFRLRLDLKIFLTNLKTKIFRKLSSRKSALEVLRGRSIAAIEDPFKKLMRQALSFGGALLVVMSFATHGPETGFTAEYTGEDSDYSDADVAQTPDTPFIMNDEGFILKSSPATADSNRIGFNSYVQHTVVSGDTLSGIAALYGVSSQTVGWENNVTEDSILNIGQTLVIPSVDGVSYTVSNKDTLESIAKEYNVDAKLIAQHNNLSGDTVVKGDKIFIPGGKKKVVDAPVIAKTSSSSRSGTRSSGRAANTFDTKVVIGTSEKPSAGKTLIFPTDGKITQGFHSGHYADDIGNSSQPDIWAAAGGTVSISKGGCPERDVRVDRSCNGGYGNYVIVDHGNGLQTLYGHMQTLYVSEGQSVSSGQALGKMGNSGRTYGPTGIHLHFEVRDDGVKKNPTNYF